jgi:hypothetical protein
MFWLAGVGEVFWNFFGASFFQPFPFETKHLIMILTFIG